MTVKQAPANPLLLKLRCGSDLAANDEDRIEQICATARWLEPHQDLIREGDRPDDVHLVLMGIACRYKLLDDGRRQITALLLPGDFCDLHVALLGAMDHNIGTMTRCRIVDIPRETIDDIAGNHPRILRGLWWATLVDEAVLREWLVGMGQRTAARQMAHFFCEMFVRFGLVGLAEERSCALPLTQLELGDILGLSTVHVNRTLQELRTKELVELTRKTLVIHDVDRLFAFARFNPNYLHLVRRSGMLAGEG